PEVPLNLVEGVDALLGEETFVFEAGDAAIGGRHEGLRYIDFADARVLLGPCHRPSAKCVAYTRPPRVGPGRKNDLESTWRPCFARAGKPRVRSSAATDNMSLVYADVKR